MARERNDGDPDFGSESSDRRTVTVPDLRRRPGAVCIWLTGLSGAGKTTIAEILELHLLKAGLPACILDGDKLRRGLNSDLGYTDADRAENVRRLGEVARLMVEAGMPVVVSAISPFRADRARARALFERDRFFEVYVDTPIDECIRRDPKGLYARAMAGRIQHFTGLDSGYEAPHAPDIRIDTTRMLPGEAAEMILAHVHLSRDDWNWREPSTHPSRPHLSI